MIVYRVCSPQEAEEIINSGSLATVGTTGKDLFDVQSRKNVSSHNYFYNCKYLHFYPDKSSIFHLMVTGNCLCSYNIPDEILEDNLGEGYYPELNNSGRMTRVPEYAIDVDNLTFDFIETIEYVKDPITIDDYVVDPSLDQRVEMVYRKEKDIRRERKQENGRRKESKE